LTSGELPVVEELAGASTGVLPIDFKYSSTSSGRVNIGKLVCWNWLGSIKPPNPA
jgi:hypothetical protein